VDGSGNAAESCTLTAGTPGWSCPSDRAAKENFVVADGVDVLQRLAAMPLYSWNFKGAANVRSIGPIAQDFHAAFGLGANAQTVAATNVAGVALAAIQGLHRVVLEKDARIDALERELHVARDIHQMELAELRRALQVLSSKMESSMR
ncbi:MAG TPA: tail fiber domain-containing protein, partial [Casimicrobiaceae bacterium]|nr:tail fiber domain-containing protein [Casimicrobiaceae bacterium]